MCALERLFEFAYYQVSFVPLKYFYRRSDLGRGTHPSTFQLQASHKPPQSILMSQIKDKVCLRCVQEPPYLWHVVVANYFELLRETYLGRQTEGRDLQTHFKRRIRFFFLLLLLPMALFDLLDMHCSVSDESLGSTCCFFSVESGTLREILKLYQAWFAAAAVS